MPDTCFSDHHNLNLNQNTETHQSDRRPFGVNFTLLPIVCFWRQELGIARTGRFHRHRKISTFEEGSQLGAMKRFASVFRVGQ